MKLIILCAGKIIRMPYSAKHLPSPLLPIKGKPIVEYIVNKVKGLEKLDHIYIVTNKRFHEKFKEWVDNHPTHIPISIIDNGTINGKDSRGAFGDAVFAIKQQAINDDLLIVGGDNIFSFTLNDFVDFASSRRPQSVIGAYDMNGNLKPKQYGLLKLDDNNSVIDFYEKPPSLNGLGLVSICVYFFPREMLPRFNEYSNQAQAKCTTGSYIQWLTKTSPVSGYHFQGSWLDIADEDTYAEAVFSF